MTAIFSTELWEFSCKNNKGAVIINLSKLKTSIYWDNCSPFLLNDAEKFPIEVSLIWTNQHIIFQ